MKPTANLPIGATATQQIEVTREMTVAHFHEHMPEVYGTPIMIYHLENTAAAAIHEYLPDGWLTVGVVVNVKHLACSGAHRRPFASSRSYAGGVFRREACRHTPK